MHTFIFTGLQLLVALLLLASQRHHFWPPLLPDVTRFITQFHQHAKFKQKLHRLITRMYMYIHACL